MNDVETFLPRVRGGAASGVLVRRIDVVKLWDVSDRKAAPAPPLPAAANLLPSSTPRLSETSPAPRDRAVMMSATLCTNSNILCADTNTQQTLAKSN